MLAAFAACACVVLAVFASSCGDATGPCRQSAADPLAGPPNFAAVVSQITFESGPTPAGYSVAQYDLWVAIPPATTANAGVILGESTPVFIRTSDGALSGAGACSIQTGDAVDVWHDATWVLGAVQAPPGDTAFAATQIVIRR